jgi:Mg-chelatase subunit ChlD
MLSLNRAFGLVLCLAALVAAADFAAAQERQAATTAGPVTFQALVQLLRTGQSEEDILKLLEQSPLDVSFVLGDSQTTELKKMRVSDEFIGGVQKLLQKRQPSASSDVTDLVLILDCSASMMDKTNNGLTKMEAASKVVTELIDEFPAGRRLGLIVYGHDRSRECQAVDVVRSLSDFDEAARARLKQYVSRLKPAGHTPIARALEVAAGEVAQAKGLPRVVLITDGMESCHGDPVQAAAALVEKTKATVDIIGFVLKPEESKAVDRIAKAGRGKYYDAQTAEKLRQDLRQVAQLAPQPAKEPPPRRDRTEDQLTVLAGHEGTVTSVAFSRDGRTALTAGEEKEGYSVRQWNAETGKLDGSPAPFRLEDNFAFSADGRRMITGWGQVIELWDVPGRKQVLEIHPVMHQHSMAFAPSGRRFIVGYQTVSGDALVGVWDVETGKQTQLFKEHTDLVDVHCVAVSPDGRTAASADRKNGLRIWEVEGAKQLRRLERPGILTVAFSPDGKYLVTGEALDALILWNVSTGDEIRRFEGHSGAVPAVGFTPDGRHLVSGGDDRTVRLWDAATGQELHRFDGHTAEVQTLSISLDGKQAISGGKDKTARIWNLAKYTATPR